MTYDSVNQSYSDCRDCDGKGIYTFEVEGHEIEVACDICYKRRITELEAAIRDYLAVSSPRYNATMKQEDALAALEKLVEDGRP